MQLYLTLTSKVASYTGYNQLDRLFKCLLNIIEAVTKYITLKKLSYFNSHTLRKKNILARSDGVSQKLLKKTNSGTGFIDAFGSQWKI